MVLLHIKVDVVLVEDYFGNIVELRLVYLAGKLQIILKLRNFLVLHPEFVLLQGYFPEDANLFLCKQHQLSLLRVRVQIHSLCIRLSRFDSPIAKFIHYFCFLPLCPNQVAAVHLTVASQRPPGTSLEDTLHK